LKPALYRDLLTSKVEAKKEIDDWLGAIWTNDLYDNFVRRRLDGTCDWIMDRAVFLEWASSDFLSNTPKMLWINGPAGYGKTIICARLIQYLSTTLESPLAYYFFSSDSESRGDPFVIIRSWISQVVACNQNAFELAYERWQTKEGHMASLTDVIDLFRLMVQSIPNCTFVVDGLDECVWKRDNWKTKDDDSRMGFLTALKYTIAQTTSRIMIISRDEVDIRSGIHATAASDLNQTLYEYSISPDDVQSDVKLFTKCIVDKKLANKSESLRDDLSRRMVERCNGMFLWVKMQVDNLRGGKSRRKLEDMIDQAPTGLDRLYDQNWMRISMLPSYDRARAFSILRWAAFALRPLTVLEITEALLVLDDDSCDDLLVDELPDDIDEEYINSEIAELCASLVEIQGAASKQDLGSMTVNLAHFSVKQYILSNMYPPGLSDMNQLSRSNEAIQCNELAKVCLRYLNFRKVWQPILSKDSLASRPFREYAARSWHQHATSSGMNYPEVICLINILFHPENPNWESWRIWLDTIYGPSTISSQLGELRPASPLYYASMLGLYDTIVYLLDKLKLDTNYIDGYHRTALQAACTIGHFSVVELILEKRADVSVADNNGMTPLNLASDSGHVEVVKLLLENGADMTVASNNRWTPLNSASIKGHVEIVKLLLEKGADITVASNDGWTPLNSASDRGHIEVVKLLLQKGADITAASNDGWTPLNSASINGHVKIVKLFLEKGADITVEGNDGWTLLNSASSKGHVEVVKLFLEKGVDITVANNGGWTPLNLASYNGHAEVVKLLLEKGADITVASNDGWTPLKSASSKGHVEVVKLLLEKGADVKVASNDGWTPLNSASIKGHVEVVKLLLEKGADMTVASSDGWTPLNSASSKGHVEVVKLLFEKGADMTAASNNGQTLLNLASGSGQVEVVKLLLEKGADITVASNNGWTPLNSASSKGRIEVVKLLFEKGADVSVANNSGWTPLNLASYNGYAEVVGLLLEKGADMTVASNIGWTPLISASDSGQVEVVKLLLKKGADMTLTDSTGKTAILVAAERGHEPVVNVLLDHGSIAMATRGNLNALLNASAYGGLFALLQVLIEEYKVDYNQPDSKGRTAAHFAARGGHIDFLEYLLTIGINGYAVDILGNGLLHYAASSASVDMVRKTIRFYKASPTSCNSWSPLHWACRRGDAAVIRVLLESGFCESVVTTTEPRDRWTPYAIAVFHQNKDLICDLGDDRCGLHGENLSRLGPMYSNESQGAGKHGSYGCDGCRHVSPGDLIQFSNSNGLGYIWTPLPLLELCGF
jgi:ankyrin repeat protein